MLSLHTLGLSVCACACLAVAAAPASAQSQPQEAKEIKEVLDIGEAIEIPGGVLGPGSFVFRLRSEPGQPNVARVLSRVDILDKNENKVIATLYAITDYLPPQNRTRFTFYEPSQGRLKALSTWFPAGLDHGIQFAYPDQQAARIGKSAKQGVFALPAETMAAESAAARPPVDPQASRAPAAPATEPEQSHELPRSASLLPLGVWVGLVALATVLLLKLYGRDPSGALNARLIARNNNLARQVAAAMYRSEKMARGERRRTERGE